MASRIVRVYYQAGTSTTIYDADFAHLIANQVQTVRRASDVEPWGSRWVADMRRSGGPILGPFGDRDQALRAEIAWLKATHLGRAVPRWRSRLRRWTRWLPRTWCRPVTLEAALRA